MRAVSRLAVPAVALALTLTACTSAPDDKPASEGEASNGAAPAQLVVAVRSDIDTFDPHTTLGEFGASQMLRLVYSSLVRRTIDGEIVPQVAESWEVTPTSAEFKIREGETCADGSPLTPTVIADSFERLADPETGSPYLNRVFPGGGATFAGDDDAGTLTMSLKNPNSDLLRGLANVGQIICGPGLADPETLAKAPSGAGPYVLASSKRGDSYVFERRDDFASVPEDMELSDMPGEITLRVVADDSAMANALIAGEVDTGSIFGRDGERLDSDAAFGEVRGEALGGEGLTFNHTEGLAGADPAFRAAVSLAIDADLYNRAATFDRGETLRSVYTPNMDCFSEENAALLPEPDVDAAASALDAAGYEVVDGQRTMPDGSPLTLRLVGYTDQNNGPQYLADVLQQLDLDVDTSITPKDQAIGTVFSNEFDLFIFPFTASLGTPVQIIGTVRGDLKNGVNVSHIANQGYEEAADKAMADLDKRCEYWAEAERSLLDDAEVVPLVWPVAYYYSKDVTFAANYYSIDVYTIRSRN